MMFLLLTTVFVNLIARSVAREVTALVETSTGPVQGEIFTSVHSTKYASFKGIRFAEPPLGHLRFKPPVPIKPWTKVLNATTDGNECPQLNSTSFEIDGSEDCLFLNVYTPVTNLSQARTKLKAVMVWIYGGAFVTGSASTKFNRPDFLVEKNVVLVSFNYRLGALGFLNLGHRNATGNAGLKDQNLALKWVHENIAKFGGNPQNVTIFGESAGAVSVGFQVLSEKSKGLFHGAISMSGTPLVPWGFTRQSDAVSRAKTLARLLGANPWTTNHYLKALYEAKTEELVVLEYFVNPITPFTPSLEDPSLTSDPFITECSIKKYKQGNFNQVPQLLGFMNQETATFLAYLNEFIPLVGEAAGLQKMADVGKHKNKMSAQSKESNSTTSQLNIFDNILEALEAAANGATDIFESVNSALLQTAVNLTTDGLFKLQIDDTQRLLVDNIGHVPIYYYDITFDTPRSRHNIGNKRVVPGAGHADDLAYVFYIPSNNYNLSLDDAMGRTIHRVSTMWTNFAKYGDPTPHWVDQNPVNVTWSPSGKSGRALEIGDQLKMVPRPISTSTEILQQMLEPLSSTFNDC